MPRKKLIDRALEFVAKGPIMEHELETIDRALREAKRDSEMLDWLSVEERNIGEMYRIEQVYRDWVFQAEKLSVRQAIAAAMKKEREAE